MSGKTVMIIDLNNFLDTSIVDRVFQENSLLVNRPRNNKDVVRKLGHSITCRSDWPGAILVLYHTFEQLSWLLPLLRQAESAGVTVVNTAENIDLFSNYPLRNQTLGKGGFKVPRFFYGSSSEIPAELGDKIVWKSLNGHQTILSTRGGVHSLNEPVYVESFIPNPEKRVLTVYSIAGCVYARWKEDPLQTKEKTRELITDLSSFQREVGVVKRIAKVFGLIFFNVEFVGEYVIDVNTLANIYYPEHRDPLQSLAEWIKREA